MGLKSFRPKMFIIFKRRRLCFGKGAIFAVISRQHRKENAMHTIEEIRREYQRLDQMIGVDTSGLEIMFSPQAVYQYGCCKYRNGRKAVPYKILIASFLKDEETAFWDTVRHEYAHAAAALLTGKNQGHGPVWQSICHKIGAEPSRLAGTCPSQQGNRKDRIRYEITCLACGARYERTRRSRFVDAVLSSGGRPILYRCRCGGQIFRCISR